MSGKEGSSWGFAGAAKEETPEPQTYSNKDVEKWFEAGKGTTASRLCVVLYGHDGVCKTGAAMDCYSKKDVEEGKQIIIFDLDGSAGPIKSAYHKDIENIVIFDPFILTPKGEIDYVSTYNKILAAVRYLIEEEKDLKLHAVIFDGLDTLLKICEYVMRYEDLKLDPDTQIKDSWQWQRRNRRYHTVVMLLKKLRCIKFFTTHLKPKMAWQKKGASDTRELVATSFEPDWEKSTPGIMFQKVLLTRRAIAESEEVVFEASIEKAKGALHLEGKSYTVARVFKGETEWYGLKQMLKELETETMEESNTTT